MPTKDGSSRVVHSLLRAFIERYRRNRKDGKRKEADRMIFFSTPWSTYVVGLRPVRA